MRISDWSSDVCSSDLAEGQLRDLGRHPGPDHGPGRGRAGDRPVEREGAGPQPPDRWRLRPAAGGRRRRPRGQGRATGRRPGEGGLQPRGGHPARHVPAVLLRPRSEEHTSELQSLMRISYAVFCLKKKTTKKTIKKTTSSTT